MAAKEKRAPGVARSPTLTFPQGVSAVSGGSMRMTSPGSGLGGMKNSLSQRMRPSGSKTVNWLTPLGSRSLGNAFRIPRSPMVKVSQAQTLP